MKKVIALLFIGVLAHAGTYEYVLNPDGSVRDGTIKRLSDGAFIPTDPDNRDYLAFLADATNILQMPDVPIVVEPPPVVTAVQDQLDLLDSKIKELATAIQTVATATAVVVVLPTTKPK